MTPHFNSHPHAGSGILITSGTLKGERGVVVPHKDMQRYPKYLVTHWRCPECQHKWPRDTSAGIGYRRCALEVEQ